LALLAAPLWSAETDAAKKNAPAKQEAAKPAAADKQTADGPAKYELKYKFEQGQQIRWQVIHRATVRSTIQGTTDSAQTRSESVKVWDVKEINPEGEIVFTHWVQSIKMTNRLPNRAEASYDSTTDKVPDAGFEQAAKAVGVPLTEIRMTPAGRILRRIQRHIQPGANNETPIAFPLPKEPVPVGHVWSEPHTVKVTLKNSSTKSVETRRRFELKGVKDGIATISVNYQVLTPTRDAGVEAQLVQRLYQGAFQFDIEQGCVAGVLMDVDKRVIGFSGPDSSMHYVMQFSEKLLPPTKDIARRAAGPALPPK
jgi:hypothetical protein